jgi:Entner-Doudoroff aldolase
VKPNEFVELFGREKASAILRANDQELAASAMAAAVRGGFRIVEFTMTTPGVLDLIRDFSAKDDLVVGAGTVMDPEQASAAVDAGARFLVSPVIDEAVVSAAAELGVAVMPGVHTPTEMLRAHRAGAQLLKLFPAPAGGPRWLRSVLGPMPNLRVVPTNGVDAGTFENWISAGAYAAGFVASLFDPGDMRTSNFEGIEVRARTIINTARRV